MHIYEIKLNVVIDRNPCQALRLHRSALEEMFEKNKHLKRGNVSLVSNERKKKRKWGGFCLNLSSPLLLYTQLSQKYCYKFKNSLKRAF